MLALLFFLQSITQASSADIRAEVDGVMQSASPTTVDPNGTCRAFDTREPSAGLAEVYVACGKKAVRLGTSERWSSSFNAATGSVVVWLQRANGSQVRHVAAADDDIHVDDVTRELAKLIGRHGGAGIDDAQIDVSRFPIDGSIGVLNASGEPSVPTSKYLDLRQYVASASSR